MLRNKKALGVLFLVLFFTLIPTAPANIFVFSEEDGYEEIDGRQEWTKDKTIDGIININPGAVLIVKSGVKLTFEGGTINVQGTMIAGGTLNNKIIFAKTKNSLGGIISVWNSGRLIMRNVDMSGIKTPQEHLLFEPDAYADFVCGEINVYGGWLEAEGSSFHDSVSAIHITNQNPDRIKVNRSKFFNNDSYDVHYEGDSEGKLNFKYNWWGSPNGPSKIFWKAIESPPSPIR